MTTDEYNSYIKNYLKRLRFYVLNGRQLKKQRKSLFYHRINSMSL